MNKFILTLFLFFTTFTIANLSSAQSIAELKTLNQAKTTSEVKVAKTKASAAMTALDKKIQELEVKQKSHASNSAEYLQIEKAKNELHTQIDAYKKIATRMTPAEEIQKLEKMLQDSSINPRNAEALRSRIVFLKKMDI